MCTHIVFTKIFWQEFDSDVSLAIKHNLMLLKQAGKLALGAIWSFLIRPVKSKDNVTEQGWLVQMIMLPKSPPPLAEFHIYLQELIA